MNKRNLLAWQRESVLQALEQMYGEELAQWAELPAMPERN